MKCLAVAITGYLIGLLTFYVFAVFNTMAWDLSYFGWAKIFDGGILIWGSLYYTLKKPYQNWVKWIYVFSFLRLASDVQSCFTGIGVNNTVSVAVLFVCLILIVCYLIIIDDSRLNKWLSKKLGL